MLCKKKFRGYMLKQGLRGSQTFIKYVMSDQQNFSDSNLCIHIDLIKVYLEMEYYRRLLCCDLILELYISYIL